MGNRLDVYVLDSDGDPVTGCTVKIYIEGFWKGGSLEESTDDNGHAEFETASDYEDSRELHIQVRGETFGPYSIDGGALPSHLIKRCQRQISVSLRLAKPPLSPSETSAAPR